MVKHKPEYKTANIYFGKEHDKLFARANKLAGKVKGVSLSGLMMTALSASIDTFEKEVPKSRSFMLNGCKVEV